MKLIQLTTKGDYVATFNSPREAAETNNYNERVFSAALSHFLYRKHTTISVNGYLWAKVNDADLAIMIYEAQKQCADVIASNGLRSIKPKDLTTEKLTELNDFLTDFL